MPGSPPVTPNLGLPRFSNADESNFATQVNSVTDGVDSAVGVIVETLEVLTMIRGSVNSDGTIRSGVGFTINKTGTGLFTILFTTPFDGFQTTVPAAGFGAGNVPAFAHLNGDGTETLQSVRTVDIGGNLVNAPLRFISIGPR